MRKILSVVLCAAMLLGICGTALAEQAPYGGIDLSKPLEITMYFTGNECQDWDRIDQLINEKLAEKVNTTINFVHISFADFMTSYSLYLNDPDIDLLYCQPTNNFAVNAAANAFMPISEEFLKTYMPLTWEKEMPSLWREATVNGTIYGIPANKVDGSANGVITSRKLMDKYGYTESDITNLEELSEYLKVVSAGEKENGIYGINCQNAWPSDWVLMTRMGHSFLINDATSLWLGWDYAKNETFDPADLYSVYDSDLFMDMALLMADWYKNGVYSPDVISNETTIENNTKEGYTVINFCDPNAAMTYAEYYNKRGDEMVFIDCLTDEDSRYLANSRGHFIVFPNGSKNMERAAIVADLLKFDEELHGLIMGGVLGEHYTLSEDGKYRYTTDKSVNYAYENRCFFFVDSNDPVQPLSEYLQPFANRIKENLVGADVFPIARFNYDSSKYIAEIAAMDSVYNEYRFALCFGLYGDETAAKVEELRAILHAAGLDAVIEDYRNQVREYLAK